MLKNPEWQILCGVIFRHAYAQITSFELDWHVYEECKSDFISACDNSTQLRRVYIAEQTEFSLFKLRNEAGKEKWNKNAEGGDEIEEKQIKV